MASFCYLLVFLSLAAVASAHCEPGFGSLPDSHECAPCTPGFFGVGGDTPCQRCFVGIQPLPQQSECIPCPPDKPIAINISTICVPVPSFGEDCPPGFQAFPRSSGCFPCDAGTATLTPSICEPCPPGTVQPLPEQAICTPCAEGTRPNAESTACVDAAGTCPAGSEIGAVGECVPCEPGMFGLGLGPCESCPDTFPNSIQPEEGQSSCMLCPPEVPFAVNGSTACSLFPQASAEPELDPLPFPTVEEEFGEPSPTSTECEPGFGTIPESDECAPCTPGFFGVGGDTPCQRCFDGIQPLPQQSECIPCPPDKPMAINVQRGALELDKCPRIETKENSALCAIL